MGCVYDGEKGLFFGRNGRAWFEILFFFFVFYSGLLSYFYGVIALFYTFVDFREPYLLMEKGFLDTPGMGFRPKIPADTGYTSLIYWKKGDTYQDKIVKDLTDHLKPYMDSKLTAICDKDNPTGKLKACPVPMTIINQHCNASNKFGYPEGKPCVLVHLNKIYGWTPKVYGPGDVSGIKDSAVRTAAETWYTSRGQPAIFMKCDGRDDIDKYNLGTTVEYYPRQGFMEHYYPYQNQPGYLQPVVMVKFVDLRPNVAVEVHCQAYAKNLKFDNVEWDAGVHFELFHSKK